MHYTGGKNLPKLMQLNEDLVKTSITKKKKKKECKSLVMSLNHRLDMQPIIFL